MSWHLALCSHSCVSTDDAGQVLSTEKQVAAQFANGGAASRSRGQWLCYETAFGSKGGIVFLEDALCKTVDEGVLQGWKGKGRRMKALNSNDGLLADGVAIFKAQKTDCFGERPAYVAFGTRPEACVKVQMQERIDAASSASSSSAAAAAAAAASPAVVGYFVGGGGEFENSKLRRRLASSGAFAAIAADRETEGGFEGRIGSQQGEHQSSKKRRKRNSGKEKATGKAPPPATQQHGKGDGRFLSHAEGVLQELAGADASILLLFELESTTN